MIRFILRALTTLGFLSLWACAVVSPPTSPADGEPVVVGRAPPPRNDLPQFLPEGEKAYKVPPGDWIHRADRVFEDLYPGNPRFGEGVKPRQRKPYRHLPVCKYTTIGPYAYWVLCLPQGAIPWLADYLVCSLSDQPEGVPFGYRPRLDCEIVSRFSQRKQYRPGWHHDLYLDRRYRYPPRKRY